MFSESGNIDISIILPVYNGASAIRRAIESVVVQELPAGCKAEIIVVNDASTDSTRQVVMSCRDLIVSAGFKFQLISHHERRGAAAGHYSGLNHASGKWLARLDHDDEFPPGYLASLYRLAVSSDADIAIAPILTLGIGNPTTHLYNVSRQLVVPGGADLNYLRIDTVTFSLCNKLISSDLVRKARICHPISRLNCWEDLFIMSLLYITSPKIVTAPDVPPYHYHIGHYSSSLTQSSYDSITRDRLRCAAQLIGLFNVKGITDRYDPFLRRLKLMAKIKYLRGRNRQISEWKATFPMKPSQILATTRISLVPRLMMATVSALPAGFSQKLADILGRISR